MNDISKDKDCQEFFACTEVAFGTGKGLLGYGICARYRRRPPGVRDAFSKALGVKNRLLWYGRDIRYRKPPSLVPNRYSVRRTASCGTRRVFSGPRARSSPLMAFGCIKKSAFCSCRKPILVFGGRNCFAVLTTLDSIAYRRQRAT